MLKFNGRARLLTLPLAIWALAPAAGAADNDPFEMRVRPLLAEQCWGCHRQTAMGGLRLDSRESILKGGKSGPAMVPGKPADSLLVQAVTHQHAKLKMPPQGKLAAEQVGVLTDWIRAGAVWPEDAKVAAPVAGAKGEYVITPEQRAFWAFRPASAPAVPKVKDSAWVRDPVDAFILARLEKEAMKPASGADKRTLIRRATFDLTGLPPTPEEIDAFLKDNSPQAFARVLDRLLASPRYGERWARHWLDLARYSDGQQGARDDTPYPNAFRYRDWVVEALNRDLPYDLFVKAQIAADQLPEPLREANLPALGFQTIGESDADRLDVTTRVFLGFTVGCAQCHDHKFDPIPTRDYYSLLGVFKSSAPGEHPLVAPPVVEAYKKAKKASEEKQAELKRFQDKLVAQVADILASQTRDYVMAAWKGGEAPADLDAQTLERWKAYLAKPQKEHPYMRPWFDLVQSGHVTEAEARAGAEQVHAAVQEVFAEKKALDDRNYVKVGGIDGMKDTAKVIGTLVDALPVERYYFWRDMASQPFKVEDISFPGGVYYVAAKDVDRFLDPRWKRYLEQLRAEAKVLEKAVPELYPFYHVMKDKEKPANTKVAIRGDAANLGEEVPRRFLSILCEGEPAPFTKGSGRLELAEAIVSPGNPLAARVMVNRLWQQHFGEGIVRTPGNFGQLGERPTHPELLDHLAARFVEGGWSLKKMHRELMLSSAYQMRSEEEPADYAGKDPENRLWWRANAVERLDAEALRDSLLAVAGNLDLRMGGTAKPLSDDFTRRTLYATVSRSKPDRTLATFDFPDPTTSAEKRAVTVGPMQRLFFMNAPFVALQAKALAARLAREAAADPARIARAYQLLYGRPPLSEETRLGLEFLAGGGEAAWAQYAQVLLGAAEFTTVQ